MSNLTKIQVNDVTYDLGKPIDATLTQAGMPADAAVTGEIKNDLNNIAYELPYTETPGYFNVNGTISPQSVDKLEVYTDKLPVESGNIVKWEYALSDGLTGQALWICYVGYGSDGNVAQDRIIVFDSTAKSANGSILVPDGISYIAFSYRTYGVAQGMILKIMIGSKELKNIYKLNNFVYDMSNSETEVGSVTFSKGRTNILVNISLERGLYKVDCSTMSNNDKMTVTFKLSDSQQFTYTVGKGSYRFIYAYQPILSIRYRLPNTFVADDIVKVYRVNSNGIIDYLLKKRNSLLCGTLSVKDAKQGVFTISGYSPKTLNRICSGLYTETGIIKVSLNDYTTYRYSVIVYDKNTGNRDVDPGWLTEDKTIFIDDGQTWGINISFLDNSNISVREFESVGLQVVSDAYFKTPIYEDDLKTALDDLPQETNDASYSCGLLNRLKPCYDHLFVNLSAENIIIPHESLYHVRRSRRMGFNMIEANVKASSDGVFFANHLISGKFGRYFHHVDGQTDISEISPSSVTWDWIVENIRYNSQLPKYQTAPCKIEDFFAECRQQGIVPFIGSSSADVYTIADAYMGKDNYVAYGVSRNTCPTAVIYHWVTKTTKQEILSYCESIGKPFIYGMSNPTAFTDAELEEIVSELHKNGFWIGASYADDTWYKYQAIGFDFNGSQTLINRIDSGNICNIDSMYGFADYTVTNASETDGVLSFSTGGTITPTIQDAVYDVCGIDIEIWFSGTITLSAIGERKATTYTSDGSIPVIIATPIINGSPKFTMNCTAGTEVYDLTFKASRF